MKTEEEKAAIIRKRYAFSVMEVVQMLHADHAGYDMSGADDSVDDMVRWLRWRITVEGWYPSEDSRHELFDGAVLQLARAVLQERE